MALTEIILAGLSDPRAELLRLALETALKDLKPHSYSISTIPVALSELDSDEIGDTVILAGEDLLPENLSPFVAAHRLRSEQFLWNPIHLLVSTPSRQTEDSREWAIYYHRLPPENVRELAKMLRDTGPVGLRCQQQIVFSAVARIAEEVGSLLRSLDTNRALDESGIRTSIATVQKEINDAKLGAGYSSLFDELDQVTQMPVICDDDLDLLMQLVAEAETDARLSGHPERFRTALHKLKNDLLLAKWKPEAPIAVARRIQPTLIALKERGLNVLPYSAQKPLTKIFDILSTILELVVEGRYDMHLGEQLTQRNLELQSLVWRLRPNEAVTASEELIKRIVVIEDNVAWRNQIVRALKLIPKPEEILIQEAGSISEAHRLLKDQGLALVLVDLGLPQQPGTELILDGGLLLIKQFTGASAPGYRLCHRFIVLTAAENYGDAVRAALDLGVSPWNYLQKNHRTWEEELRSQVRLAFQQKDKLPAIEVFKQTGRIARLDGFEFQLDRSQWCLLAALADSRSCGRSPERIAREMYYQYSLVPESRSEETALLDPVDRIILQIPHYASELRARLTQVFTCVHHRPPENDFIAVDEESGNYRLHARAQLLDRVDEHFRIGRRPVVLVVEDDANWGREITEELQRRGFEARWARFTNEAWDMIDSQPTDLISLDLELPATESDWLNKQTNAVHAVNFLSLLRQRYPTMPVAVLTAVPWRDIEMLQILQQGVRVDDYLSKRWAQPIVRLAGSLARLWQESLTDSHILNWDPMLPIHSIEIDPETGILMSVDGFKVAPAGQGKTILKVLSATPNVAVSRTQLIDAVYGNQEQDNNDEDNPTDFDEGLKHHIKRLRKSITDATGGTVSGDEVIRGDYGVYWLRGIAQ